MIKRGKKYDYLIVGAGLFGSVFAHEARLHGKSVCVIDRRNHIAGNLFCEKREGINIHTYGAHIFHTSLAHIWKYVNQFTSFNHFINAPLAIYKDEIYNLPFNMNTFSKMWGIKTPEEAKAIIQKQCNTIKTSPRNLEEQAISLVGYDVYEKLIKGYTEKQWGRKCTELPAFIIKRLPVRYTYDNNYFNDMYQGIPSEGYNVMIERMLDGVDLQLQVDFLQHKQEFMDIADKIIYTGPIDEYYNYDMGVLEYRSLKFEMERIEVDNYQGVAVVNYTDSSIPYTRIIEHKHFEFGTQPITYITREYPESWFIGKEAYYPVNDVKNLTLYAEYKKRSMSEPNIIFGGRLGEYKYYDMDKVIASALNLVEREFSS